MKAKTIAKSFCIIVVILSTLLLSSCTSSAILISLVALDSCRSPSEEQTIDDFNTYKDSFNEAAQYLLQNAQVLQITEDGPPLDMYLDCHIVKADGVYMMAEKGFDDTIPEVVLQLFKQTSLVRIFNLSDERAVEFDMVSELGYGRYLVYSETGEQTSDEYASLVQWMDDHWYLAETAKCEE